MKKILTFSHTGRI